MIPDELKNYKNWVIWHREHRDGKITKVPYNPNFPDQKAESDNLATWGTFIDANTCSHPNKTGIGFVFNGSGICGIDLDHSLNDGKITKYGEIFAGISSYTEISPSGDGLHILFRCDEAPYTTGKKKGDIEIYSTGRFFTVTGNTYQERTEIKNIPAPVIRELLDPYIGERKQPVKTAEKQLPGFSDSDVLSMCHHAKNGDKFYNLFDKGLTTGYASESEADSALAGMLKFYTQNPAQIRRLMERSKLTREKWKRDDYLGITIDKALNLPGERYTGHSEQERDENLLPEITEEELAKIQNNAPVEFKELPELPEGFFKEYVAYGERMSYAYPAFHFGNALALISLIAGRKVVMQSTGATIYPNVYVACIGQTSTSGKSTACDIMFKDFFGLVEQPGIVEDLTKKMSPQGLLQRLAKVPTRLWYYDECSEFFSDVQNRWAESLESILCSVYDGRSVSYGLAEGRGKTDEYRAKDVFLSLVWNTTDSEMENRAQWSHVTNGFLPRFMWFWCHSRNTPRKNRPVEKDDTEKKVHLLHEMQELRSILMKIPGECMIRYNPHDLIEEWRLQDDLAHLDKKYELHRIATARLVMQAYKIAILFSIMDKDSGIERVTYPVTLDIPDKYAELAKRICEEYLRPRLMNLMDLAKNNDTKNYQIMVIRALKKYHGTAKKSVIQHDTHINKRNFDETIQSLIESETIEEKILTGTGGRAGIVYQLLAE